MPDIKILIMAVTCCYDSNDLSAPFTFTCIFLNSWKCMNLPIFFFCPFKIFINFSLCTRQLCHNRIISSRKTYIYSVWDDMMCFWINNPEWRDAEWSVVLPLPRDLPYLVVWRVQLKGYKDWSEFFWDWDFGAFWCWEFLIRGVYMMNYRQIF